MGANASTIFHARTAIELAGTEPRRIPTMLFSK